MIGIKKNKGFTLIELIVVMAVFLIIIATAVGIFISIVQHQRRIMSEQELLNQISYVVEYMSKALRMAKKDEIGTCLIDEQGNTGYIYLLTKPDTSSGFYRGVKFINQSDNDACQEFFIEYIDDTKPELGFALKEIKKYSSADPDDSIALTSDKVKINSIKFGINGSEGGIWGGVAGASENDDSQPRITISLDVQIKGDNQPVKKIQTTVSQRNLNVR